MCVCVNNSERNIVFVLEREGERERGEREGERGERNSAYVSVRAML